MIDGDVAPTTRLQLVCKLAVKQYLGYRVLWEDFYIIYGVYSGHKNRSQN